MRILMVAAVGAEVAPIVAAFGARHIPCDRMTRHSYGAHEVDLLLTGVGMVAAAAWCSRALAEAAYDLAINVGVCGSFRRTLEPGAVVHVTSDRLAELGAEDGDALLTLEQLGLAGDDVYLNPAPPANAALAALPAVRGITVNTVHGDERSIAAVVKRFAPDVESMEGAGFMCACLIHAVPFAQVRAVSNLVERRNRAGWKMTEAVDRLGETALAIVERL